MLRSAPYIIAIAMLCAGCSEPHPADPVAWGEQIYARSLCGQCHGPQQRGTIQGPPLQDLRQHWTPEELAAYLAQPMAFVDTRPRLRALADHYKVLMPALPLRNEERAALAAFLLQKDSPDAAPPAATAAINVSGRLSQAERTAPNSPLRTCAPQAHSKFPTPHLCASGAFPIPRSALVRLRRIPNSPLPHSPTQEIAS